MAKFKIGDRVIATKTFADITAGKIYTVAEVDADDEDMPVRVTDDVGDRYWLYTDQFTPALTIEPGRHYRTRSGKPTGRVTVGDTGFEAVVDGRVRIFDKAGGAVHGDDDIVEAWVPKVGERVRYDDGTIAGEGAIYNENHCREDADYYQWLVAVAPEDREFAYFVNESCRKFAAADLEPLPVAPQPAAPTLKIEAGRYYKTRDGRKVGPLVTTDNNEYWPFKWPEQTMYYKADGYSCPGAARWHRDQDDLIAEWQETTNVGVQVDTLAEEYGSAPADRKLVRTGQGYGYELARFGDYVWVDTGKTAPITLRADKLAA